MDFGPLPKSQRLSLPHRPRERKTSSTTPPRPEPESLLKGS